MVELEIEIADLQCMTVRLLDCFNTDCAWNLNYTKVSVLQRNPQVVSGLPWDVAIHGKMRRKVKAIGKLMPCIWRDVHRISVCDSWNETMTMKQSAFQSHW